MEQAEIFSNEQVDPGALPDFQRVELTPVVPAYLSWALITQTAFWLILAGAAVAVIWLPLPFDPADWPGSRALPLPFVMLAIMGAVYARLDARTRAWALREHDLVYRHGVVWRKTVILPFARIQHVEAMHGPLERYLGLMRLKCYTAGGLEADLTVKGLDAGSARRVRQYLLEQIGASADAEVDAAGASSTLPSSQGSGMQAGEIGRGSD
ncbi:MAG: PH domain-containing protein [Pseudomonadota bacterium]|nr:MAG: PH domain-containing protein [Pseudomonadota bacterium]